MVHTTNLHFSANKIHFHFNWCIKISRTKSNPIISTILFSEIALYALDVYYNQTYLNQSSKYLVHTALTKGKTDTADVVAIHCCY